MERTESGLLSFYKIFRWVLLLALIFVIIAALKRPLRPALPLHPEEAQEQAKAFDSKLDQLTLAHERGEAAEARFTTDEVNAAIADSLTKSADPAATRATPIQASGNGAPAIATPEMTAQSEANAGAPIRTAEVAFRGDEVTGQFATEIYGKAMYITISGKLGSRNGYVTFDPTGFKVGDLSVPVYLVNEALQRKLAEPENREKLKLPAFVADLRVENSELVIVEK